jgi:mannose-1-phosphate guanylyltransferase
VHKCKKYMCSHALVTCDLFPCKLRDDKMNYAVILAGGSGKRFWPLSREKRPKQVLKLLEGKTLLNRCFERMEPIFDARNIIVLTNAGYVDIIRENLSDLPSENVIAEPAVRDTAGAIGLVSSILTKYDPDATIAVVTADQIITPPEKLQQAIKDGLAFVNNNPASMITFGIQPGFASTQFGYIKCAEPRKFSYCQNGVQPVEAFKEKPDAQTAEKYVKSGRYFWNSGLFVWKAKTILAYLAKFLPESIEPLNKIRNDWGGPNQQRTLDEWFVKLPKISIDYAVMEKADKVFAIKLDGRWLDVGSFAALADLINSDENHNVVVAGQSSLLDCHNNIIVTEDKGHLIAAIGLEGMVVAHCHDATFVCPVDQTNKLKELIEKIKQNTGEKFL